MDFDIHTRILLTVFAMSLALGAIGQKTRFCTMGALSDWMNMGDTGRMRAWVFAMAIALMFGLESSRALNLALCAVVALGLFAWAVKSRDFRASFDHWLGGAAVGLAVVAGWYITGGLMGQAWKEYAEMATIIPSRVQTQSYTFIAPMGDTVRYLADPGKFHLVNFGIAALSGVHRQDR